MVVVTYGKNQKITFKEGIIMKCNKCSIEITPWMLCRWGNSAFRFRCSQCKTLYKVNSPYLIPITIGISLLIIIFVVGAVLVGESFGIKFLYLIFGLVIFFAIEYLADKYILRKGILEEVEEPKSTITPALFHVLAFCFLIFGFFMLGISAKFLSPSPTNIFMFMMFIFILFFEIIIVGMVFGVKREVEKLKDKIKE
jgi:hypothetical protein